MEHQYSLKWNNHPHNISSVFTRLRNEELFVDVTLATADRQIIRGHRVVLSAGSGYLERILAINPSEHPTIVLANLKYRELKLLVDFMYSGEISVDQPVLGGLLEAASWLQIKGLYESGAIDGVPQEEEEEINQPDVSSSHDEEERNQSPMSDQETKPRKRVRSESASPVPSPPATTQPSPKVSKAVYGLSNTGWLLDSVREKEKTVKSDKDAQDIPNLLNLANTQNFLQQFKTESPCKPMLDSSLNDQMIQAMQLCGTSYLSQLAALQNCTQPSKPLPSPSFTGSSPSSFTGSFTSFAANAQPPAAGGLKLGGLLNNAPVRRYKQYTEDSLQAALKEIMEGQSINRSSMKHNIPARTLRDWMKRLNIKSVYTHHSSKDKEGSVGSNSPEPDLNLSLAERIRNLVGNNAAPSAANINTSGEMDEDESSETLKIDESCQNLGSMAEMAA